MALPVGKLVEGTRSEGAKMGELWRINFSRVEWTVAQVADDRKFSYYSRLETHIGKIQLTPQRTIGCGVLRGKFRCTFLRGNITFGTKN